MFSRFSCISYFLLDHKDENMWLQIAMNNQEMQCSSTINTCSSLLDFLESVHSTSTARPSQAWTLALLLFAVLFLGSQPRFTISRKTLNYLQMLEAEIFSFPFCQTHQPRWFSGKESYDRNNMNLKKKSLNPNQLVSNCVKHIND